MISMCVRRGIGAAATILLGLTSTAFAQDAALKSSNKASVMKHWTPERRAAAIPRDLFIDSRGLSYVRGPFDSLRPHGHTTPARELPAQGWVPLPFGKPAGGGTSGAAVTNSEWTAGGVVKKAAGRIYFYMPDTTNFSGPWSGYVCSGTVVNDGTTGRSVILTAAHCVYDDVNKAFAKDVMFIPDQDATTGTGTDRDCNNDPYGCWVPEFGVVDKEWTARVFPNNVAWDYAFYVVSDASPSNGVLDSVVGSMTISFTAPLYSLNKSSSDRTHALGYSYQYDPNFMYCAEDMSTNGAANWWLSKCGLSGGASGGPWVQPMSTAGDGPVISVNSWGYTNQPGMAGPRLNGTSAINVFALAKCRSFTGIDPTGGKQGVVWPTQSCQ